MPPEALTKNGINNDLVKSCTAIFFQENSSQSRKIFLPPHVLIRETLDGLSIPSVLCDNELVFSKQIIGVYAPEHDRDSLDTLSNSLNNAHLYGVMAAVISSRMLVGRATSLLKSDIMALPFFEDSKKTELNFWEQALIETRYRQLSY